MMSSYNEIDALVLSVIYEHNQIDLIQWTVMIDFYERIVLTFEELSTSLGKLQRCGLIHFSNNEFVLSSEAHRLFPKRFNIRNYRKIYDKLVKKEYAEITEETFKLLEVEYSEVLKQYKKMSKRYF